MYSPGPSKEYIRESVFLYFKECSHILTLPNLYFGLESRFVADGKKVDCTEYKVNTFEGMTQEVPKGVGLYNKNAKNMPLDEYNGIFLDFLGTFNKDTSVILNKIAPGTRLALTFLMARENKKLQEKINIKSREESYVKLLAEYNVSIEKYANYCDTVPMCVFYGIKTEN